MLINVQKTFQFPHSWSSASKENAFQRNLSMKRVCDVKGKKFRLHIDAKGVKTLIHKVFIEKSFSKDFMKERHTELRRECILIA